MTSSRPLKFSYEFFPPRTSVMTRRLWRAVGQLERLEPEFFSMTYGALGSDQQISIDAAIALYEESPVPVAAHLTCANATRDEIDTVARKFHRAGFNRIVALRGDSANQISSGNAYNGAAELVKGLRKIADFDISVAAYPEVHPQASSAAADLEYLKRKLDAGANRAITQFFFDADCFLRFRDRAIRIGIEKPVIPGILPIHNLSKVSSFSQRCGASLPNFYQELFDKTVDDQQAQYRLSVDLAVELCERLVREGVERIHLYTLNQTDMCLDISLALGANVSSLQMPSAA
ncbi:MAG: methylenetetrahydrofolate reductase [NAD(P)H] [Gammaproteobacteria bacterium]|nr:methylenetetrahydrofolate reductase [NAD(P)H] [Gammaproteobacteria bacterium]